MKLEELHVGQRVRVNLRGVGDTGQIGTIKKMKGSACSVHLDWDWHSQHVVVLYPADLDLVVDEPLMDIHHS